MNVFTVKLRNEPGAFAKVAEAIANSGVDILAVGGGGIGDAGVGTLITDNDVATRQALQETNCEFSEAEAIVADLEDQPGTLARAARALADAGVNLTGLLIVQSMGDRARLAFAVDDAVKAREALASVGATGM
jgi:hypothetical protein